MIALYDFLPHHCPNCGERQKWDALQEQDFLVGCAHTCGCGMRFQFVSSGALQQASKEGEGISMPDLGPDPANCPNCAVPLRGFVTWAAGRIGQIVLFVCPECGHSAEEELDEDTWGE